MMQTVMIDIAGMACGGCAGTIQKALIALDGVADAQVSHVEGRAEVSYNPAKVQPDAMHAAIKAAGYVVK